MYKFAWALVAPLLLVTLDAAAQKARKIECWTDNKGVRVCGDRVPPEYAKQERQVYDKQGRVVDTRERQKTPEEIAAEKAAAEAAAAEKARLAEEAKFDKFLTDTYSSLADLVKTRDTRIATVDGQLRLAEKAVADSEASLKGLQERADAATKAGREPDKKLKKQIAEYSKGLQDNRRAVASLKAQRDEITRTFDRDIERYKVLRPESAQAPPEKPKG